MQMAVILTNTAGMAIGRRAIEFPCNRWHVAAVASIFQGVLTAPGLDARARVAPVESDGRLVRDARGRDVGRGFRHEGEWNGGLAVKIGSREVHWALFAVLLGKWGCDDR